uniref:Tyrosine specific protein phosphatases domain-containing protein n=1 Tax=Panagrolaimus sp. JU765 TaxID=591449 RepID=A0AC34Q9J2_9BILA
MTKLPEKWTRYKNIGERIEGTRFVPFKTPLNEDYFADKVLPITEKLTFNRLMHEFKAHKYDIGLVIDLTTSFKYYDPSGWSAFHVEYKKLRCDGSHVMERRAEFNKIVDDYLKKEPVKLIGVHCVHGLNRTGYLICAYLVERMGWQMKNAIEAFEKARGHKIETSREKLAELEDHLLEMSSSFSTRFVPFLWNPKHFHSLLILNYFLLTNVLEFKKRSN